MGELLMLQCRRCHEMVALNTGLGFSGVSLRTAIAHAPSRARRAVLEILDHHTVHSTDYEHRLFECPRCDSVHSRFYVRIEFDDAQVFEPKFKCRRCRATLVQAARNPDGFREYVRAIESYSCWKCGEKALEQDGSINWD